MNAFRNLLTKLRGGLPAGPPPSLILGLLSLGGGAYVLSNGIVTVQPGHQGLIYNRFGGLDDQKRLGEGFHIVLPWFQRAIIFDTRTYPQLVNTASGSKGPSFKSILCHYIFKIVYVTFDFFCFSPAIINHWTDLQMVQISIRVLYRPNPGQLPTIYRQLGTDYPERVLPSIVNEITKAVVAQYNASELLTKRDLVSQKIRQMLVKRSADFNILLDDVAITHLAFSKEYTAAVEAKQVAQQDAERAKYIVERAIQEKKTIIVKAQGEAAAAEMVGKAILSNPAYLQLRRIDNSKEVRLFHCYFFFSRKPC